MIASCGHDVPSGNRFCGQCGTPLPSGWGALETQDTAERRLITVVFCDLIGSTELSSRLDPEDLRGVLMLYHATCTKIVDDYGGYVAQHLGDGILAYYGYSTAHEDDARRAVAAALEITRIIPGVRYDTSEGTHERLGVRIGIDSGLTIAGQIGYGGNRQSLALGETPNVAARLQAIAQRNAVVISGDTYRLVDGDFEFAALGPQPLRGVARTVDAYHVLRDNHTVSPSTLTRHSSVPMIGRATDLSRILADFERAALGEQRLVVVKGEAGIGKSRLLNAAHEALEGKKFRWVGASCLPFYTNTAHYAAQILVEELAGLTHLRGDEDRLARLDDFLDSVGCPDTASLVASALGFETVEAVPGLRLSPEARKEKTFEAYLTIFRAAASAWPLVLAVEDVQLADPSTIELITLLTGKPSDSRLLVILTARVPSDADLSWIPPAEPIELTPLTGGEGRELLRALSSHANIPEPAALEILSSSGGIPIYIEELAKDAVERGAHGVGHGQADVPHGSGSQSSTIPIKVRSSVTSRLDRLGGAKLVAQLAATVAETFDEDMIAKLTDRNVDSLRTDLHRLVEAGILTAHAGGPPRTENAGAGAPPRRAYRFRHALLQEVAYDSLLKRTRQTYHSRIAGLLESDFIDDARHRPELVAHHWSEARCPERALPHLVRAAEHFAQRYANKEAAAFYKQAVESFQETLRSGHDVPPEWRERQSELRESLGDTLTLLVERENAEAAYREAIAHMVGHQPLARARIVRKIGVVWQQEPERALSLYEEASQHLGADQSPRDRNWRQEWVSLQLARVRSHYWFNQADRMLELVAEVRAYMSEYASPLQRSEFFNLLTLTGVRRERYAVSAETLNHARDYVTAAHETGELIETASARLTLGVVLFCGGNCQESIDELQQALLLARQAGHPTFEIRCLTYLCSAHRRLGHVADTMDLCDELLRLATERHMVEYAGMAHSNLAWAALSQGDASAAERHAENALRDWDAFQVPYPFQWTARLPLLVMCALRSDIGHACEHARAMLRPEQHVLPVALNDELERFVARLDAGDEPAACEALKRAIAAAQALQFLHLAATAS